MAKYIGRLINVWVGIEGTRGTAVSADIRQAKTDFSFEEKAEYVTDEASQWSIVDSVGSYLVKKYGDGDIGMNVSVNSIGYWLYALLGTVSVSEDSTSAYIHSFSLQETNQSPSLTTCIADPVLWDLAFPLTMIESMTLSAEEGQQVTATINVMSKPWSSTTNTVTYTADYPLLARNSTLKLASNLAWLDGASGVCFKSFEITFEKNLMADYCVGQLEPVDFINQQFSISGSFSATFENDTHRANHLDGTTQAIRIDIEDTNTTIGASSNPRLRFDLAMASLQEFARTQGNNEVVTQTITFKGIRSLADGEAVSAELVNTVADYTA